MAVRIAIHVDKGTSELWARGESDRAFEEMYRRWYRDVLTLCRKILGKAGDAEAAAQEAFLRVWLARDRYSPVKPFWPWIAIITRRCCLDQRRRYLREQARAGERDESPLHHSPEVELEVTEDLRLVFRAIDGLRPHERRVLVLREMDGWSYQQIAGFEGVTVESVRGSLKRARASLRRTVFPPALEDDVVPDRLSRSAALALGRPR